jgi:hypothetical protein
LAQCQFAQLALDFGGNVIHPRGVKNLADTKEFRIVVLGHSPPSDAIEDPWDIIYRRVDSGYGPPTPVFARKGRTQKKTYQTQWTNDIYAQR